MPKNCLPKQYGNFSWHFYHAEQALSSRLTAGTNFLWTYFTIVGVVYGVQNEIELAISVVFVRANTTSGAVSSTGKL